MRCRKNKCNTPNMWSLFFQSLAESHLPALCLGLTCRTLAQYRVHGLTQIPNETRLATQYQMKKVLPILTCLLLFFSLGSFSQSTSDLFGKWQFEDFYNLTSPDTTVLKETKSFWHQFILVLKSNKEYKSEGLFSEEGLWDFNKKNKIIVLRNKDGNTDTLNVIKVHRKKLILTFSDNQGLVLSKISSN
jgi:hypothetical protein